VQTDWQDTQSCEKQIEPFISFHFQKMAKRENKWPKNKKIASGKNTSSQKEKNSPKWPVSRKMEMAKKRRKWPIKFSQ
jgi:hypothetical protein